MTCHFSHVGIFAINDSPSVLYVQVLLSRTENLQSCFFPGVYLAGGLATASINWVWTTTFRCSHSSSHNSQQPKSMICHYNQPTMHSLKRQHSSRSLGHYDEELHVAPSTLMDVSLLPPRKVVRIVGSSDCRSMRKLSVRSPQDTLFKMTGRAPQFYNCSPSITFASLSKDLDAWNKEVLLAVRSGNVTELRSLHHQGHNLKCTNRFGETLLHLACRKGLVNVVAFLLNEVQMPANIHDDTGRTPLHDAFWTPEPNPELVDLLVLQAPAMLWVQDQRGHCPLQYSRVAHHETWNAYLNTRTSTTSCLAPRS
jgi:Ankyrin repeats (3 copies)